MNLDGKTALITGGSSGIGLGIAAALAAEGCRVALTARNPQKLEQAAGTLPKERIAFVSPCDVAVRSEVDAFVARAIAALGRLDIVVNSAGMNIVKRRMSELDPADFDRLMAVNCTGLFNVLHAVLPQLRQQSGGLVINISSVAGKRALPLAGTAYCASKFAATALGTEVCLEERAHGIRITNIYPGEVDTPILDLRPVPVPAEKKAKMVHAEDIGALVVAVAKLPPHVLVPELVITPLYQEYL